MSTEHRPFAKPTFTADDFARNEKVFEAPREQSVRTEKAESVEGQPMFAGTPIYARTAQKKSAGRSSTPALMIGVPAVALLAGVTYFAMQPRQSVMTDPVPATAAIEAPVMNSAAPVTTEVAAAEAPPPAIVSEPAAVAAKPAARAATPTRVAARPAPRAEAASSFARDASATPPAAPIPYSALSQTPAPAPAIIVPPPVAAPAEATSTPVEPTPTMEEPATISPPETPATTTP